MKAALTILLYAWQLPQNILGGISLGRHIIMNDKYRNDEPEKMHEWGHTRQSLMLGWLYLAVIGLPSILWASRPRRNYFSFWTERWADTLGGVRRCCPDQGHRRVDIGEAKRNRHAPGGNCGAVGEKG